MPRIHGPPQPHRPTSSLEVGLGRGPSGYPMTAPPQHPTTPSTPQVCQPVPMPFIRQNAGPKLLKIVEVTNNESKKRLRDEDFMSLGATDGGKELNWAQYAHTHQSTNLSDGMMMETSSYYSKMSEDCATALCGFGSSDARDESMRRVDGRNTANVSTTNASFAPLCRTAEEACFGFEISSPTTTARQRYLSNQNNNVEMKDNSINHEKWQNNGFEMSDVILLDDDSFNSVVHSR